MTTILCAGHVNWDVTMRVDELPEPDSEAMITDRHEAGGGSAANTAAVLAGLDRRAAILGSVGADDHGTLVEEELCDTGVDCTHLRHIQEMRTTVKYIGVDKTGELMMFAHDGANEQFSASDLTESILSGLEHLHMTGQHPETARALLDRARSFDLTTSIDPGRRIGKRNLGDVVRGVDVAFFNEREADVARETGILPEIPENQIVVEKRGGRGARVIDSEGTSSHAGFEATAIDTAGAGDAFNAGFLTAWLAGADWEEALELANACGAVAIQSIGARTTIQPRDLEQYVDGTAALLE